MPPPPRPGKDPSLDLGNQLRGCVCSTIHGDLRFGTGTVRVLCLNGKRILF